MRRAPVERAARHVDPGSIREQPAGQARLDEGDAVVHHLAPFGQAGAEHAELVRVVPGAEPQREPAARQHVDNARLLQHPAGMRERQQNDRGAEADPAGLPGQRGEHRQLGREVPVVDAVLLGRPDVREPEALRGAHQRDAVLEVGGLRRHAGPGAEVHVDAQLAHGLLQSKRGRYHSPAQTT